MKWITDRDLKTLIKPRFKQIIQQDDENTLEDAIETAIETAAAYLRQRYDVSLIFFDIPLFDATDVATYTEGLVVRDIKDVLYVAKQDSPSSDLTDVATWDKRDPRNKALVEAVMDIAIYNLHSNISPNNIPALRVKRYDTAMSFLNKIQKEQLIPDLPTITDSISSTFTLSTGNKTAERW